MSPDDRRLINLSDGRQLAWAEYGKASAAPVMFFHGGPGSRLPLFPGQERAAAKLGVRLVCPERPGFGDSTRHPERTLPGWADDLRALADELGLGRFAVIGYSAGAPFALACAARLPGRVTRAVAVGCGAPWDLPELAKQMDWPRRMLRFLARRAPWLLRLTYRSLPNPRRKPEKLLKNMLAGLPKVDQEVLGRPEVFKLGAAHTAAGVWNGFSGMADEVLLLARPWGFELESIRVPVILWTGSLDSAAPPDMARFVEARIPNVRFQLIEGEGHLCIVDHWEEILASSINPEPGGS